ncbi:GNAT family N-acetyltransferase [Nocardioides bizhenqiangii]|uniref:GNAT family N-acetyltransferase n=1 Tax=Nocardioides bizhenqiangii TaxID=3095076 RepID=A0ABZ0ZQ80_9ACTN|nr:GNAT family N-acetyltransferase [Nocardioides sp. HM61]WQQ25772.1 GNAT family N-acetyltransferase [Nocardioides sp. HM61]
MSLQIEVIDPFDDEALAAWLNVLNVADEFERGDATTFWTFPEIQVVAREPRKHVKEFRINGSVDGVVVAAAQVRLPQLDNLSAADVEVSVLPDHRRRGYGSEMLHFSEAIAKEHGRTRFDAMTAWKYDGPADGTGTSGVEFGKVHGYAFGLGDVQREVTLPVDDAVLAELEAEAAERSSGYELRTWEGPFPDDELLLSYLEVASKLITEAPTGDLDYEDEAVDIEAHRIHEAISAKQGRTTFTTVALASDGTVAAYTDLMAPSHDTTHVYQWGTLASRAHRGHRLGLAVKIANLRALQATGRYDGRRLVTWNAEVNDHMIAINHRMGFVPTARAAELQKKIS